MRLSKKCEICRFVGIDKNNKKSRVGRIICTLCDHWSMGNHMSVMFLGLIGTMITAFDIIRIMNYTLPRRSINSRRGSDLVPQDVERDLKLMTSILGIEHYTLIMLGAMTGYPMLHTPWLLMQLCVIFVEIGVFFMKLILDGLHIKLDGILLAIFTLHNWLQQPRTLYVRVMCLVVSCLSSITLELGARSPLGHSVTKSTAFSYIFRRSYNVVIKVTMGRFVSAVLSTILLTIGEEYKIPFLYMPWMFNTLQGIFFYEAPTLLKWTHNQIPYVVIPASTFAFITLILFLEQLFHWCDVFASFMRTWIEYIHRKRARIHDEIENIKNREKFETISDEDGRIFDELEKRVNEINPKNSWRRVKSLSDVNYANGNGKNL